MDRGPFASQEEDSSGSMSFWLLIRNSTSKVISTDHLTLASLQGQSLLSSLQGQSLSSIGTTNTYSTNSTQSIKEGVSQLLQASQSLPFSFQRQTSTLRKIYDSMLQSSDVGEIGNQIGLTPQEILTWFEVEKLRREIWSPSLTALPFSQIRQESVELPTSMPFLEQIRLLRGSFDQNQWPSKEEYIKFGRETCIDPIDVMFWFDVERDIQLQCLQPIPVHVPGFSTAEPAYEPTRQGNSVNALLPTPHGPLFNLPGNGERMSPYAMELSHTASDARFPEPMSCLGKRTRGQFPCLFCKKHFKTMAYWRNHQTKVHFLKKSTNVGNVIQTGTHVFTDLSSGLTTCELT
jgi:hypothetical protein